MRINEIFDDPMDDEKALRQKRLQASLNQMAKQYAPRPKPSAAEVEATNQKHAEHKARRDRIEQSLAPIAQKFAGNQFEEFKREAESFIPPEELKIVDLQSVFSFYNPDKKRESEQSWVDYGKSRARGDDPQIHGMGPTGKRNWTGD